VTVDVGTGDGRAVLAAAARDPRALHIGLDPVAGTMAESSRRAARRPGRGGLPNVLFVVAAAEAIPVPLRGLAARVTVHFPWASLLRGCLGADAAVARGVVSLVARDGTLELLLAPAARDRLAGLPTDTAAVAAAARATFEDLGLTCIEARGAAPGDVGSSGSTWAKRLLGGGSARPARSAPPAGLEASAGRRPVLVRFRSP
jgi:16S rRNA (adenine(1408)-N(1))-methyltransferase